MISEQLISVDKALEIILSAIKPLSSESVNIIEALNRISAEDIYSDINIPLMDNSAMDGYALRAADIKGASLDNPKILEIIDDIRAGFLSTKKLAVSQAVRIMTGAAIPKGADSVVMVEHTKKQPQNKVKVFKETQPGENVRRAGEDIKKGELVIKKGTLLSPAYIGILASIGKSKIKVSRQPKVAILATGDELVEITKKIKPGKIHSSNTYTLCSQVLKLGGIAKNLGIARDNPKELENKLKQGLDCDLIFSSGGVSVGDYDFVKFVLAKMGTNIKFWKVAMKPGKPLVFGMIKNIPIFGLPGNPVSSMVSFEVFVRPVILKMTAQTVDNYKEVDAILEEDIAKKKRLRYFIRANTRWEQGKYFTRTTGDQGSGILKSMALANSLIILSEEEDCLKKGARVKVRFLE